MRKLAVALLIGCLLPCPAGADEGTPREKPGGEPAKTTPRRRPRPSVWSEMGLYFKNRGEDFLDIWRFQGGLGLGLHADVEATDLLHASVGASRMNYRGPVGREMLHVRETQLGIPVANYFAANTRLVTADEGRGVLHEIVNLGQFLVSLLRSHDREQTTLRGTVADRCYVVAPMFINNSYHLKRKPWVSRFELQAGVSLLVVGGRFGISLGEFADFFGGIFGADIAEDDRP